MTAKFVLLGPKSAVLSVLNRVVDCTHDFLSFDNMSDDSDVVLFEILTPNGSVLRCYNRESISDWFERGAQNLPDSRLLVQPADVERIITTDRQRRSAERQFRFYEEELQRQTRNNERRMGACKEELDRVVMLNRELGKRRRLCEDENSRLKHFIKK